ncbi:hypothetical protein [Reinekea marinisedimentorum]|uniref:Uncharacterized protein n=1 Tax=Reinekea marinisedimentorum TaxID=230495 RepID=A0A4R3HSY5_9GAMM|nr:hypothetical protein [Reinekea marinisedimentorum]TCS36142.1 hypothetical protein BCF53_12724 [Reinekea marinisedimentorum]
MKKSSLMLFLALHAGVSLAADELTIPQGMTLDLELYSKYGDVVFHKGSTDSNSSTPVEFVALYRDISVDIDSVYQERLDDFASRGLIPDADCIGFDRYKGIVVDEGYLSTIYLNKSPEAPTYYMVMVQSKQQSVLDDIDAQLCTE